MKNIKKGEIQVYPVYITKEDESYIVYIPDFDINTFGDTLANAVTMARDAIGLMGIQLEDENKELPAPFSVKYEEKGEIQTLVDIDFYEYRRKHDNRMVKKNCTIPYYLNVEAEKMGINFSRLLQEALIQKIGC